MLKQVTFNVIKKSILVADNPLQLSDIEMLAIKLTADAWRLKNRVLIACNDQAQAEKIDEALWQLDPNQFVPHNLSNEITSYITPIEICWPNKRSRYKKDILISLMLEVADFCTSFNQIIDFVPFEDKYKERARERYKQYRALNFELITKNIE